MVVSHTGAWVRIVVDDWRRLCPISCTESEDFVQVNGGPFRQSPLRSDTHLLGLRRWPY
jgi:hypothetical protein